MNGTARNSSRQDPGDANAWPEASEPALVYCNHQNILMRTCPSAFSKLQAKKPQTNLFLKHTICSVVYLGQNKMNADSFDKTYNEAQKPSENSSSYGIS